MASSSSLDLSFLRSRTVLRRIALATAVCGAIGVAYALLAPKWYRSVVTVVPAKPQKAGISGLLGGDLGGLAAGLDVGGAAADASRIAAVLQSISVSDAVIAKFDLRARYRKKYQESTRDALWDHCDVKTLAKPNLVQLTCEDKDPAFVRDLLSYFAQVGNEAFRRVSVSSASEEVRFLEKRVVELRQQADDSARRMRDFQEKHKIIDLDTQAKAVVSAMATLNKERLRKQLEFDVTRAFSAEDEATARQLRSELSAMGARMRDLEEPSTTTGPAPGEGNGVRGHAPDSSVFPAALSVPKLRAEFEQLYRDRKVSEATLVVALERLESAKANEARDVSTFVVLDPPTLPTRHERPRRLIVVAGAVLAGLFGALALEWIRAGGAAGLSFLARPQRTTARESSSD